MIKYFRPKKIKDEKGSPSRIYADRFFKENLKKIIVKKDIDVLDIGCGSGYIREIFYNLGYKVNYVGVDLKKHSSFDSFSHFADSRLVIAKAEEFETDQKFDLILSLCSLEHMENDRQAVNNAKRFLKSDGFQVHLVPAKWSYCLYFNHGYRRYDLKGLFDIFGKEVVIYRIGGFFSSILHFFSFTIIQRIIGVRQKRGGLYYFFVKLFSSLDFSYPTIMYLIINE